MARFICVHSSHKKHQQIKWQMVQLIHRLSPHFVTECLNIFQLLKHISLELTTNDRFICLCFSFGVAIACLLLKCFSFFFFFLSKRLMIFGIHKWQCVSSEGKSLTNIQTFHSFPDLIFTLMKFYAMCDCLLLNFLNKVTRNCIFRLRQSSNTA